VSDFILHNMWAAIGGYDFTLCMGDGTVTVQPDVKDYVKTNPPETAPLADGVTAPQPYKSRVVGAQDFQFAMVGYWDDALSHPALSAQLNLANVPLLFGVDRHIGDEAWIAQVVSGGYSPTAKVNEVAGFSLQASGSNISLPGKMLGFGVVSTTGQTPDVGYLLGAVPTGKGLYLGLQVVGRTGTATFTGVHKTAATQGGSYVTRHTFGVISAAPGAPPVARVAGPITDTYHKLEYTIGGTGTITFRYAAGII
jgi:hypothetical protein